MSFPMRSEHRYRKPSPLYMKKSHTPITEYRPVTVADRSKACTVFARSEAVIGGSNPTQGMVV
jgi:hypothetical protein